MRPTASNPNARSPDPSAGLHNFIPNRFSGDSAKVDIGDPSVNLQNKRFWRLHGWIESRWTEFRRIKRLGENDPAYLAAIKKGTDRSRGPRGAIRSGVGSGSICSNR